MNSMAVTEQQVAVQQDNGRAPGEPDVAATPLGRLVQELVTTEAEFNRLKAPYLEARDNVQLLRMEIIELLQKEEPV